MALGQRQPKQPELGIAAPPLPPASGHPFDQKRHARLDEAGVDPCAAGKARLAAVGACLRKLLRIAEGVLKNRAPFDPSWALK